MHRSDSMTFSPTGGFVTPGPNATQLTNSKHDDERDHTVDDTTTTQPTTSNLGSPPRGGDVDVCAPDVDEQEEVDEVEGSDKSLTSEERTLFGTKVYAYNDGDVFWGHCKYPGANVSRKTHTSALCVIQIVRSCSWNKAIRAQGGAL
jgi:hypothetical protein